MERERYIQVDKQKRGGGGGGGHRMTKGGMHNELVS